MNSQKVFFYLPNLIGYVRIILAICSFYYISQPGIFLPLYGTSCILDAVDGYFARLLSQCSKFGTMLDMVTDRSTTAGLTCYLGYLYPKYMLLFQLLIGIDISSHYMHMYSSLLSGSGSHKNIGKDGNPILRLYYTSRIVLFLVCALNELFYISLYCFYYKTLYLVDIGYNLELNLTKILFFISAPVWGLKQIINLVQLLNASMTLASLDSKTFKLK